MHNDRLITDRSILKVGDTISVPSTEPGKNDLLNIRILTESGLAIVKQMDGPIFTPVEPEYMNALRDSFEQENAGRIWFNDLAVQGGTYVVSGVAPFKLDSDD